MPIAPAARSIIWSASRSRRFCGALPGAKSAGRVQSVSLRLIVDREREIELFRAQEYWSVAADMEQDGVPFIARLVRWKGQKLDRLSIGNGGDAAAAKADVETGRFSVTSVETKP